MCAICCTLRSPIQLHSVRVWKNSGRKLSRVLGSRHRKTEEDFLEGGGREREGEHLQERPSEGTVIALWTTLHFCFFTRKQTPQIRGRGSERISETSVNPMAVRIFTLH